jgi:putative membrane protein
MKLLVRLLINMVAILGIAYLFPSLIRVDTIWAALGAAILLGIVNAVVRPIFVLLTLPLTILTGLVGGFQVNGFWGAFFGSILISFISWLLSRLIVG